MNMCKHVEQVKGNELKSHMNLCTEMDSLELKRFLEREAVLNTFIISDIEHYGFNSSCQKIYKISTDEGIRAVFLKFFHNLIIYGDVSAMKKHDFEIVLTDEITTIMGPFETVINFSKSIGKNHKILKKNFLILEEDIKFERKDIKVLKAEEKDIDELYDFIISFPEFREVYKEREMLRNRICKKEGIDLFIRNKGEIIAHINSAATNSRTAVLGGLCVKGKMRGRGYAKYLISQISEQLSCKGKTPCVLEDFGCKSSVFRQVNFKKINEYGICIIL